MLVGLLFLAGVYPLWRLQLGPSEQMLGGVYATLGIFLLLAFTKPVNESEPNRVHGMVEPYSRRHYGGAGIP